MANMEKFSSLRKITELKDKKSRKSDKLSDLKKKNSINANIKPIKKVTRFFRFKSLVYLLKQDKKLILWNFFLKRPFFHSFKLIKSYLKKAPYIQKEDLFFFNINSFNDLTKKAKDKNSIFVFGYSYCMKPKDCPSKRFTKDCIHDKDNEICQKCEIFHQISKIPANDILLIIPDAYYIGIKLAEIIEKNPKKEIIYIIITCNMCINMFSDLSNMLNIKGLSIELSGRVCRNYKSFLFAEKGIKSGITNLYNNTDEKILDILKIREDIFS
ncbi:MAG: hypothetical protein KR126chlam6_00229 [Candidatus Anoxychlamydiales bacterium]|nr:hypothetical protein [Candidatus Anoxychlamydiales bacterium]